ncbi:MAG TPA: MmgE/PrpD family protein [Dehalococcoidia bacterium]|nr:MmgE/PrpD family protein [Dehalococcoidia bacterium]
MQLTEELARFITDLRAGDIPSEARALAVRAILDTAGVMLAGSREDCARIAADVVRARESRPVATVVGAGFRTTPESAAFVNGVAGHALDYDDVNSGMTGHPSVPLVPAVLAVGEETGASGREIISAFIAGFEVETRLGRAIGRSHYERGWHATATMGVLGSAAVSARLYGLSVEQTQMALGIAVSLASGSRQNFGTMTKPLHPGHASQNGIVAAQLAARGFTADATAIEAPLGFFALFSSGLDSAPEAVLAGLGSEFEMLDTGISVKNYPCCFGTHRAIQAILDLRAEDRVSAGLVEQVNVLMPRGAASPLIHSRPTTGLEGKFSMEYCVAAALLDGRVGLSTFEDSAVQRPAAQELLRKVGLQEADVDSAPADGFTEVRLRLRGGEEILRRVDEPRGGPGEPLTLQELTAKFRDCSEPGLGAEAAERALRLLLDLERLDTIAELTSAIGRPVAVPAAG